MFQRPILHNFYKFITYYFFLKISLWYYGPTRDEKEDDAAEGRKAKVDEATEESDAKTDGTEEGGVKDGISGSEM